MHYRMSYDEAQELADSYFLLYRESHNEGKFNTNFLQVVILVGYGQFK